jgi:hypothetical protein
MLHFFYSWKVCTMGLKIGAKVLRDWGSRYIFCSVALHKKHSNWRIRNLQPASSTQHLTTKNTKVLDIFFVPLHSTKNTRTDESAPSTQHLTTKNTKVLDIFFIPLNSTKKHSNWRIRNTQHLASNNQLNQKAHKGSRYFFVPLHSTKNTRTDESATSST